MKKTKIVILGGGFAGLYAAKYLDKRLARRDDVEVTLITRENFILFTPMLHEVAAGDLSPGDIIYPARRAVRHVKVIAAEVTAIDVSAKKITCVAGLQNLVLEFEFDHVLLALGSETNFFGMQGVQSWAVTMKSLQDAALLRNRMVALLEEASLQSDESSQRELLTFVVAGGGFAGAETIGAINDFVRETAKFYPSVRKEAIRVVVVHPGDHLLPELGKELGAYAEIKLRQRKVEVIKGVRVANYNGAVVTLSDGRSIPASTVVWTAGVKPSPVVESLACEKQHGRILVSEYLAVTGIPGLWAAGDCAAVPKGDTGEFHPPTAQHGLREAIIAGKNIEAVVTGGALKSFRFRTIGLLAAIGHRTGVAMVFGFKFSGFIAWWMWRTIYLAKLPGLAKKLRVMVDWTLDLFFGRQIEQMITLRDVAILTDKVGQIRARMKQSGPATSTPALDTSAQPTLARQ